MSEETARVVELVRVPRQEQVFDRDTVLGRDSSSVFPTESKQAAAEAVEALKAKLGANRFITETEVLKLQKQHGAALEEAGKNNKPLAQVLLEAKQAKEEAFQNQWKQMKQGKNRPLDEEEIQFVDSVEAASRQRELQERQQEQQALDAYQLAVSAAAEARQAPAMGPAPPPKPRPSAFSKPARSIKPAKPKSGIAIKKHSRAPADAEDKDDLRRKQVRLTREGTDPVSSSLAVPSTARETTEGRVIVTQEDIVQPTAGGPEAFPSAQIEETASYDHATISVEREGQDPLATSLPLPDAQKSLAGFLADYGSGSDDSEPGA